MALRDKTLRYDPIKPPFIGHALADLLEAAGGKWIFQGTFSFESKEEYEELKFFDSTASEEDQEIDPWTGDPKNLYTYSQVKEELPTWEQILAEHEDNMAEYNAYEGKRNRKYPDVKEQLDMLFKDIESGLLGPAAKSSSFYTTIKTIKDNNP